MPDLDGNLRFPSDADRFIERLQHCDPLRAHVCRVDAAMSGRFTGQGNQLLGRSVRRGCIFQGRRHADRTVQHRRSRQRLHLIQLRRCRRSLDIAEHHPPNLRCADVSRQIDSHALSFRPCKVLIEGAPVGRDFIVVVDEPVGFDDRVVERRYRAAFARDLGCDPLEDLGREMRVHENREFRLTEHIDEAGSDD